MVNLKKYFLTLSQVTEVKKVNTSFYLSLNPRWLSKEAISSISSTERIYGIELSIPTVEKVELITNLVGEMHSY